MILKHEDPCRCTTHHDLFPVISKKRQNRDLPDFLNKEPPVYWYQCDCGRYWMRIGFEGYHTNSFTFYTAHVERADIENFNIDLIDEIFLASDKIFDGGYDLNDRIEEYKGGFPVDPWSGFRREARLKNAKEFAITALGNQNHGGSPFILHLQKIQDVMDRHHIASSNQFVRLAGWLHHILRVTAVSKEEIVKNFGEEIADLVCLVSGATGAASEEKKAAAYRKIRGHINATVIMLCDRIAVVESALNNPQQLQSHKVVHPGFMAALCVKEHTFLDELWGELNQFLE